jgi:hypothetical protein
MAENISYSRIPADAAERWKVVRDVCAGDQALRNETYLPTLNASDESKENIERNANYRNRAVLYTATSFTRDGLLGLAFRRDPDHNLPDALKHLLKNADGNKTSIYQQSQMVTASNVEVGRHGLFVDFSEALKLPIIKSYRAEDIINWDESTVAGQVVLTLVVLQETVAQREADGYAIAPVTQYRELLLEDGVFICRIKQIVDGVEVQIGDDIIPRSRAGTLDFIPFQFVGSQNNDSSIDPSPLYGLAKVNVAHFRNSADYEDSVFYHGQVQATISGLDTEWRDELQKAGSVYVGSRAAMLLPVGGKFEFAQAQPNMLAKEAMDHKETQMIALGARMIEKTTAAKTATGENNDREATTSVLALCVANVSEAYQACIGWCARYLDLNIDPADSYKINQDFVTMSLDPQTLTAIVGAWQSGAYAKPDLRAFLRRIGLIAVERTDEQIDSDLQEEGPALGEMTDATDNADGQ